MKDEAKHADNHSYRPQWSESNRVERIAAFRIVLSTGPQTAITPAATQWIMASETNWENLVVVGEFLMIIGVGYSDLYARPLEIPLYGLKSPW